MLAKEHIMPLRHYENMKKTDLRITPAIIARLAQKDQQARLNLEQELAILSAEKSALTGMQSPTICFFRDQVDDE